MAVFSKEEEIMLPEIQPDTQPFNNEKNKTKKVKAEAREKKSISRHAFSTVVVFSV